jgi:hypothetical protein
VLDKPLNGCNYFIMLWIGVAVSALLAASAPANMVRYGMRLSVSLRVVANSG